MNTDGGSDFFVSAELEEVRDGAAFAGTGAFGNLKHALDIAATALSEEHEVVVRGGGEEILDEVAVLFLLGLAGRHADDAFAAAFLGAEGTDECAFDKAVVRKGDDHTFVGDEVFDSHLALLRNDLCAARGGVFSLNLAEFILDDREDAFLAGENVHEVFDGGDEGIVFAFDAVALHAGELIEAEVEDVADLLLGEAVFAIHDAGVAADEDADLLDGFLGPTEGHELLLGVVAVLRIADDFDEVVKVGEGNEIAFELLAFDFSLVE